MRYDAVNGCCSTSEHRKNEEQRATIAKLKTTDAKQEATIARQQEQIEALMRACTANEIALVLVRLDHIARVIVKADHSVM